MRIKERSYGVSKENLKFTIGARNYQNYTEIGGRSALDLRAEVGVVHGGVHFDEKGLPSVQSFVSNQFQIRSDH
jgi:hypothetical protein